MTVDCSEPSATKGSKLKVLDVIALFFPNNKGQLNLDDRLTTVALPTGSLSIQANLVRNFNEEMFRRSGFYMCQPCERARCGAEWLSREIINLHYKCM